MTSPLTVSLEVPFADTEQQFLILAVQAAVRAFRSITRRSADHSTQEVLKES